MNLLETRHRWLLSKKGMFSASLIDVLVSSTPTNAELKNDPTLKFGKGAMTYINKVAVDSITELDDKDSFGSTYALEQGIKNESFGFEKFKSRFQSNAGLVFEHFGEHNPTFFKHPKYSEDAGCSPDCKVSYNGVSAMGAEFKCPEKHTHFDYILSINKKATTLNKINPSWSYDKCKQYALKEIDPKYYGQVQFQMMCLGVDLWYWCSYN